MPERDMSRREEHTRREGQTQREGKTNRATQDGSQSNEQSAAQEQAQEQTKDERQGQTRDERRDPGSPGQGHSADRKQDRAQARERDAAELERRWPEMSETAERDVKKEFSELLERADQAHAALDAAGKQLGPEQRAALNEADEAVDREVQGGRRDVVAVRDATRSEDESSVAEASERLEQRKDQIASMVQQALEAARRKQAPSTAVDVINQALGNDETAGQHQRGDVERGRRQAPEQGQGQEREASRGEREKAAWQQGQEQEQKQQRARGEAQEQARDERRSQTQDRGRELDELPDRVQERGPSQERDAAELKRRWPEMSEAAERDVKKEFSELLERADQAHAALAAAEKQLGPEQRAVLNEANEAVDREVQGGRRDVVAVRDATRSEDESGAAEASERLERHKEEIANITQRALEAVRQEQDAQRAQEAARAGPEQEARHLDAVRIPQATKQYLQAVAEEEQKTADFMNYEAKGERERRLHQVMAAEPPRPGALEAELSAIERLDVKTRELVKWKDLEGVAAAASEREVRLAELGARVLDSEARAYVSWMEQLLEARKSLQETDSSYQDLWQRQQDARAAVERTKDALRHLTRTVDDLLRSGPLYQQLSRDSGPDEVMGEQEWARKREAWSREDRKVLLEVDHVVAVAEIAKSAEMRSWLDAYNRSSMKKDMEQALLRAFDTRENLRRIVAEVNRVKGEHGWASLSPKQVHPYYTEKHLEQMKELERTTRKRLSDAIRNMAEQYDERRHEAERIG